MSIFDTIVNVAEKHPQVNKQQHSTLIQSAAVILPVFRTFSAMQNGTELGIVQSWIGSGSNQPIATNQVDRLLGQDRPTRLLPALVFRRRSPAQCSHECFRH
jgi:uncharacterized protein YidB (DUF937 family)